MILSERGCLFFTHHLIKRLYKRLIYGSRKIFYFLIVRNGREKVRINAKI